MLCTMPVLPAELWNIIMTYKEQLEYRDDCILEKKGMRLRSGRLVWSNKSRIGRFINESCNIAYNMGNNTPLKLDTIFDLIKNHYYFVKTLKNKDSKKRTENLICSIEKKIIQFYWILVNGTYNRKYLNDTEKIKCLEKIKRCRYFIYKYDMSINPEINIDIYDVVYENDFWEWCNTSDFEDWCK